MKKIMLSSLVLLPLIVLLILTLGGMVVSKTSYIYVDKVEFSESDTLVLIKDGEDNPTAQLEVDVLPLRATDRSVTFSSDDESIVTVDENGLVTGLDYGTTFVRAVSASNGAKSAMRRVLVTDESVHRIEISGAPGLLYTNESAQLSAKVYPQDAQNVSVNWESDHKEVLSVDANGRLDPKSKGVAVITASSVSDPDVRASVTVEVRIPVTNIYLAPEESSAETISGREADFPQVHFNEGAQESVAYESSDDTVATVDEEGKITFLKAGTVRITATVTDGTKEPLSVSKTYTSTLGAYVSIGFNVSKLEADFDECQGKALALYVTGTPEGANAAYEISFSEEGVLAYDAKTGAFTVTGTSKNGVVVTVKTRAADGSLISGKATIAVTRKATKVSFSQEEMSLSSAQADLSAFVTATEMHTDTLVYSVSDEAIASVDGSNIRFAKEGTVTVTVRSVNGGAQAEMRLTYISDIAADDVEIVVDENYSDASRVVLDYYGADTYDSGILIISPPQGYTLEAVESDDGAVVGINEDMTKILPKKGGYATVTVRAKSDAHADWVREVEIFVHAVATDLSFAPEGSLDGEGSGYVTAKAEISFGAPSIAPEDAQFEKTLVWSVDAGEIASITQDGKLTFKKAGAAVVKVCVMYGETEETYRTLTVRSTFGQAESFELYSGEQTVSNGQRFVFSDLGREMTFVVGNIFPSDAPADIALLPHGSASFTAEIDGTRVTFTAKGVQEGEEFSISVGNASVGIQLTARALAEKISLTGWNRSLANGTVYRTFDEEAAFTAVLSRADGVTPSDMTVQWSTDKNVWKDVSSGVPFSVPLAAETALYVRSADGGAGASDEFAIEKITELSDFGLRAEYSDGTGGVPVTAGSVESVKEAGTLSVSLPRRITKFVLSVRLPSDGAVYVGILPESVFAVSECSAWATKVVYDPEGAAYSFDVVSGAFSSVFTLSHGENGLACSITVEHSGIESVELTGYDMDNADDLFAGYQQVRVFGKQSYYGSEKVNYFKVPLKVIGESSSEESLSDYLTWELTPYKGDERDLASPVTLQTGRRVTYNGSVYEISTKDGEAKLVDEEGNAAPDGVTWVDTYTEEGIARIYFGNFNGLSETDIRNDNFGNFDYLEGESALADGKGPDGKSAVGTGTYLSVVVSDGTGGAVKDGFNFNVVNDGVNVFDAKGYTANSQVVLQADLYAKGENSEIPDADARILTSTGSEVTKTLIYGNGHQINFAARNDTVAAGSDLTTSVGRAYNVVLKGTTVKLTDGVIDKSDFKTDMTGSYFYYCQIMACYKGIWPSNPCYIKNTTFQYMKDMAVQISNESKKIYIENVVIVDAHSGLEDQKGSYYVKGFVDGFNFMSEADLGDMATGASIAINHFKNNYKEYCFSVPKSPSSSETVMYANAVSFMGGTSGGNKRAMYFYNGSGDSHDENSYASGDAGTNSAASGLTRLTYDGLFGLGSVSLWTYPTSYSFIQFECQKIWDASEGGYVENGAHLALHLNRVHRDLGLLGENVFTPDQHTPNWTIG